MFARSSWGHAFRTRTSVAVLAGPRTAGPHMLDYHRRPGTARPPPGSQQPGEQHLSRWRSGRPARRGCSRWSSWRPAGEAPAAVRLDADSLLARRGLLQQAVLASAVPSRRVLPETEQPVREVGLLRVVRERRVAELVQRGTAVAANILMTVYAADVAQPLTAGWHAFQQAVGDDTVGWDMASASAHVWPGALDRAVAGGPGTPWPGDARLFHRGPDG